MFLGLDILLIINYIVILMFIFLLAFLFLFGLRFFFVFKAIVSNMKKDKRDAFFLEIKVQRFIFWFWVGIIGNIYGIFFIALVQLLSYKIKINSYWIYGLLILVTFIFNLYLQNKCQYKIKSIKNCEFRSVLFYFWPRIYWKDKNCKNVNKILKILIIISFVFFLFFLVGYGVLCSINNGANDIYFGKNLKVGNIYENLSSDCFLNQFLYLDVYNTFDYPLENIGYEIYVDYPWVYKGVVQRNDGIYNNKTIMPGKNRVRVNANFPLANREININLDYLNKIQEIDEKNNKYYFNLGIEKTDLYINSIRLENKTGEIYVDIGRYPITVDCPDFSIIEIYIDNIKQENFIFTGFHDSKGVVKLRGIDFLRPHKIKVVLDPYNLMKELNESNNEQVRVI